jgi:hypothetical protein
MDINRENFEAYLLDYEEGNLTLEEQKQVETFMYDNQDLAAAVDFFDGLFPGRNKAVGISKHELLKDINQKTISEKNVDEFIIADLEGELSGKNSWNLELYIENHPSLRKDYILYANSFLKPPPAITYPNKQELIRGNKKPLIRKIYPWMAMAGSILLLVGFYFFITRSTNDQKVENNVAINDITHPAHVSPVTKVPDVKADNRQKTNENPKAVISKEKTPDPDPTKNSKEITPLPEKESNEKPAERTREDNIPSPLSSFEFHVIAVNTPPQDLHPVNKYYLHPEYAIEPPAGYKTIPGYLMAKFNDLVFPGSRGTLTGENSANGILWALADVGIKGVNKITDKEIALNRHIDPEGNITRFSLEAEKFEIARIKNN